MTDVTQRYGTATGIGGTGTFAVGGTPAVAGFGFSDVALDGGLITDIKIQEGLFVTPGDTVVVTDWGKGRMMITAVQNGISSEYHAVGPWHTITLLNQFATQFPYQIPQWRKEGPFIRVRGNARRPGLTAAAPLGIIPISTGRDQMMHTAMYSSSLATVHSRMDLKPTGILQPTNEGLTAPDYSRYCGFSGRYVWDWSYGMRIPNNAGFFGAYGYSWGGSQESPMLYCWDGSVHVRNLMTGPAATSSVIQDWISAAYNPPADIHIYRVCSQNGGDRLDVGSAAGAAAMRVNGAAGWINLGFDFVHADTSQNIPATLLNGWVNYLNTYCVAAYQKKNDIVYVQGLVRSGTVGGVIMNLPVGYRPPNDLIIGVDGSGAANSNRILEVRANGDIAEMSNIQMGNAGYLSLDGINFSITP